MSANLGVLGRAAWVVGKGSPHTWGWSRAPRHIGVTMLRATVSGSFRRHMAAIYEAVTQLVESGVEVLSPADPRVVDQIGDFVFVASDRVRSIKLVEDRHLEAIRASDLLWLVAPDGYVGQSASMELGYALASGTPIFGEVLPTDTTLQKYVRRVPNLYSALAQVGVHR